MVTASLRSYIQTAKLQGKTDEQIASELTTNHWSTEDIQLALTPQVVVDTKNSLSSNEEKPSKWINILSWLFYLTSLVTVVSIITSLSIIHTLHLSLLQNGGMNILRLAPALALYPIFLASIWPWFMYLGLKVRKGSKRIFWLSLITILLGPVPNVLFSHFVFNSLNLGVEATIHNLPKTPNIPIPDLLSLTILLVFYKKFHHTETPIPKKIKLLLIIFMTCIIIGTVSILGSLYFQTIDPHAEYNRAAALVTYHLYQPVSLPTNLSLTSTYITGQELKGIEGKNVIKYTIGAPIEAPSQEKFMGKIVVAQVGVMSNFNMQDYIKNNVNPNLKASTISMASSKDSKAYLGEGKLGNADFTEILFITEDNVLIQIAGLNTDAVMLQQVADSLQ